MRKLYILFLIVSVSISSFGMAIQVIKVNGIDRTYMVVTPEKSSESPGPLIVFLHGIDENISDYQAMAQQAANETGAVILLPQALGEQDPKLLELVELASSYALEVPEISSLMEIIGIQDFTDLPNLSAYPVWGAGMSAPFDFKELVASGMIPADLVMPLQILYRDIINAGKIELNGKVDDVSFINQAINEVKAAYNIDQSKIYMAGVTIGGAMAYKYAYSENSQISALAVIFGFIGNEVDHSKTLDIPVCIFNDLDGIDYFTKIWECFGDPTNIEDVFTSNSISFFYPNPAKETISFSVSGDYELKNIAGKTILKGNAATGETISIGNIPAGLYIVMLKSVEGNYANKLIVK